MPDSSEFLIEGLLPAGEVHLLSSSQIRKLGYRLRGGCIDCGRARFRAQLCKPCWEAKSVRQRRRREDYALQGLCRNCGKPKDRKDRLQCLACRESDNSRNRTKKAADPEKFRAAEVARRLQYQPRRSELRRAANKKLKAQLFKEFGGVCRHCGFSDPRALQIDHINGGGTKERRARNQGGFDYFKAILRDPDRLIKYQLLCANCNWIKRAENGEVPYAQR